MKTIQGPKADRDMDRAVQKRLAQPGDAIEEENR